MENSSDRPHPFAGRIEDFIRGNPAAAAKIQHIEVTGSDAWDLRVSVGWAGLGDMIIRRAAPEDLSALREFLMEGLSDHSRFLFAPYPYEDDLGAALEAVLSTSEERNILLYHAWLGDKIIGHFFLGRFGEAIPDLGIAIADHCHGIKLGHLFMTLLVGVCATAGKEAIDLTTNPQNHAGFHLYKKIGFEHIGDREITVGNGIQRTEHEMRYRFIKPV